MKSLKKVTLVVTLLFCGLFCNAERPDWDNLISAIATIESGQNPKKVRKDCVGYLQIRPCAVRECNNILKSQKSNKRFSLNDRYNKEKSIEMFWILQDKFNPTYDIEKALKIWKAGPYAKNKPRKYIENVMNVYQNLNTR